MFPFLSNMLIQGRQGGALRQADNARRQVRLNCCFCRQILPYANGLPLPHQFLDAFCVQSKILTFRHDRTETDRLLHNKVLFPTFGSPTIPSFIGSISSLQVLVYMDFFRLSICIYSHFPLF